MAMNFGKGNRSVAFNPTSAFPLDARSYFESLEAANAAAALAREAGSTESVYYYGQTLVVVEDNKATLYVIQPDNSLAPIAGESVEEFVLVVDNKAFIVDAETGELQLKGLADAEAGHVATVAADGSIAWTAPIDAYTKAETDAKIAAAAHLKRKVVTSIADIQDYMDKNDDAEQYIFMVPADEEFSNDKYDEYMVLSIAGVLVIEKVGSWEVSLADYATKDELNEKVDKEENARLITNDEADKLAQVNVEAEKNVVNSVSQDFELDSNRNLSLKPISISKVTNLQETLNGKVDKEDGHRLINPTEIEKLGKLTLDDGELVISSKVSIENVTGLQDWLNSNAATTPGLSENNLTDELYNKLVEQLTIKTVNTTQLDVTDGHLSIKAVEAEKITGLNDLLALKADASSVSALSTKIGSLESSLNDYKTEVSGKFEAIEDRLTWHGLQ